MCAGSPVCARAPNSSDAFYAIQCPFNRSGVSDLSAACPLSDLLLKDCVAAYARSATLPAPMNGRACSARQA